MSTSPLHNLGSQVEPQFNLSQLPQEESKETISFDIQPCLAVNTQPPLLNAPFGSRSIVSLTTEPPSWSPMVLSSGSLNNLSSSHVPSTLAISSPASVKPSLTEIFEQIGRSICKVQTSYGTATGILIGNNLVVVPLHVAGLLALEEQRYKIASDIILCYQSGKVYIADCCTDLKLQNLCNLDCAVFKINDPDFKDPGELTCFTGQMKPGRKVYFGGFPLVQDDPTFHKGHVSSTSSKSKVQYFTMDATVVPGNSGGPVFVLEENELLLAGFITHQVAELNPDFMRKKEMVLKMLNHGWMSFRSAGLSVDPNKVLAEVINVVFDNLSTGIGSAICVQPLLDLLRGNDIPQSPTFQGLATKHGTLRTQTVSKENIKTVKKAIYCELLLFFYEVLNSRDKKIDFYSKLKGQQTTIYSGSDWRIDRQAPPTDNSANVQVQYRDRTVATVVVDASLLEYGGQEHKIREIANYVAFQFVHALKFSRRERKAVVLKVLPKV